MIFLSNEAFPLVFGEGNDGHNWSQYVKRTTAIISRLTDMTVLPFFSSGVVNLTFLAYVVGGFLSVHPPAHLFVPTDSTLPSTGASSRSHCRNMPTTGSLRVWATQVPRLDGGLPFGQPSSFPLDFLSPLGQATATFHSLRP